jgi:hypothetical protein
MSLFVAILLLITLCWSGPARPSGIPLPTIVPGSPATPTEEKETRKTTDNFDLESSTDPELADPKASVTAPSATKSKGSAVSTSLARESNRVLSTLEPRVAVLLQHDNNVFLSSRDEQSEQLAIVRPMLNYHHKRRKSVLDVNYMLETGKYFDIASEDYTDHYLDSDWVRNLSTRKKLRVQGQYVNSHQRRYLASTNDFRDALVGNSANFEDMQIGFGYAHGNRLDRSRMELRGYSQWIRLDESGPGLSRSDRDVKGITYGYFWHLRRRLSVFAEGRYKSFDYKEQIRDSSQTRIVVGSELRLRKRVSATVRIGYENKDYDRLSSLQSRADYGDAVWDFSIHWRPRPNTTIEIETVKDLIEVEQTGLSLSGVYAVRKNMGIDWTQAWSSRLSSLVTIRFYLDDVQGTEREDELRWFRMGATYAVMQKLHVSVDAAHESRKFRLWPDADRSMITLKAEYRF